MSVRYPIKVDLRVEGQHDAQPPWQPLDEGVEDMPPLRFVKLDKPVSRVTMFQPLRRGMIVGGARVIYCDPPEGIVAPTTLFQCERVAELVEEGVGGNVVITLKQPAGSETYVYPRKVWELVKGKYIEPMLDGRPPLNPGILFTGPPGTGKSTMLHVIASSLGLPLLILDSSVLKPYLGETEKTLVELLQQAEASEPCLVAADEVEWILQARIHQHLSGYAASLAGFISTLLVRMQRWKNEGRRILIAAATNIRPSELDQAFLRAGRFGAPVNVPLPDAEAVEVLMARMGVPREKAAFYARRAVNAGLSMADVVELIEELKKGREPEVKGRRLRGYYRFVPPPTGVDLASLRRILPPRMFESPRSRVALLGRADTMLAVLTEYLLHLGKPIVYLFDVYGSSSGGLGGLEEAASTAEQSGGVLVFHSDYTPPQLQHHIHLYVGCPVVAVGEAPPAFPCYTVSEFTVAAVLGKEKFLKLLLDFHEVKHTEKELREALAYDDRRREQLEALLRNFAGGNLSEALNLIGTIVA